MMVMVMLTLGMSALHTSQQTLGQGLCHNICHKMKCLVVQMFNFARCYAGASREIMMEEGNKQPLLCSLPL